MKSSLAYIFLLVFTCHECTWSSTSEMKRFESVREKFSVLYPSHWNRVPRYTRDKQYLDIINYPLKNNGPIVIYPKGAEIIVYRAPAWVHSITQEINRGLKGRKIVVDRILRLSSRSASAHACTFSREVKAVSNENPGGTHPYFLSSTALYCNIHGGIYDVVLDYWTVNPQSSKLNKIAIDIAKSLRVW